MGDADMVATAVVVMEVMAVDTARGRPRLSPATAMAVMAADMVVTAVVVMEVTGVDTARGRPRLSLATAMVVMAAAMVAMVVTAVAMAATGVSYHRRRRSELSEKQNRTKIFILETVKTRKEIYLNGPF